MTTFPENHQDLTIDAGLNTWPQAKAAENGQTCQAPRGKRLTANPTFTTLSSANEITNLVFFLQIVF